MVAKATKVTQVGCDSTATKVKQLAGRVRELNATVEAIGHVLEAYGPEGASAYAHLQVGVDVELEELHEFVTDWIAEREAAVHDGDGCDICNACAAS